MCEINIYSWWHLEWILDTSAILALVWCWVDVLWRKLSEPLQNRRAPSNEESLLFSAAGETWHHYDGQRSQNTQWACYSSHGNQQTPGSSPACCVGQFVRNTWRHFQTRHLPKPFHWDTCVAEASPLGRLSAIPHAALAWDGAGTRCWRCLHI